jgi:predicted transcriptional regulator
MNSLKSNFTQAKIKELAKEFKQRRSYLNISQLKLAKVANISQSIITKFETGKIDPTLSTILKLEQALNEEETISNKKAKDIMIKNIKSIILKTSIQEALTIMRETDFSQLLVIEQQSIKGIITEKKILDFLIEKGDIKHFTVKEILEQTPIIIPGEYLVTDLKYLFQNKKTQCIIVGSQTSIDGIITKTDIFK